jgi:hypothetical protein
MRRVAKIALFADEALRSLAGSGRDSAHAPAGRCAGARGPSRSWNPSPSSGRITDRDFTAAALKKVGTGAGAFHQQTIVFRWAAASIGCGHFDSWPAADAPCCHLNSGLRGAMENRRFTRARRTRKYSGCCAGVLQNRRSQAATPNRSAPFPKRDRAPIGIPHKNPNSPFFLVSGFGSDACRRNCLRQGPGNGFPA